MQTIPTPNTPILIVDDDERLLSTMETIFIQAGLPSPALLSDSRQTLTMISTHNNFQVVLINLNLPLRLTGRIALPWGLIPL